MSTNSKYGCSDWGKTIKIYRKKFIFKEWFKFLVIFIFVKCILVVYFELKFN